MKMIQVNPSGWGFSRALGLLMIAVSTTLAGDLPRAPDLMPVKMLKPSRHAPVKLVRKGAPCAVVYVADAAPSVTLKKGSWTNWSRRSG
ncbi:MAG: hypothetical protein WCS01_09705 [bacterium]